MVRGVAQVQVCAPHRQGEFPPAHHNEAASVCLVGCIARALLQQLVDLRQRIDRLRGSQRRLVRRRTGGRAGYVADTLVRLSCGAGQLTQQRPVPRVTAWTWMWMKERYAARFMGVPSSASP